MARIFRPFTAGHSDWKWSGVDLHFTVRLTFQLRYRTFPGQSVFVTGNDALLGDDDVEHAVPLEYCGPDTWRVQVELPNVGRPDKTVTYRYIVRQPDGSALEDWGYGRGFDAASLAAEDVLLIDSWNDPGRLENAFYTEPFRKVLLKGRQRAFHASQAENATHTFRVRAPLLEPEHTLCILGSSQALAGWNVEGPVLMSRAVDLDWLSAEVNLSGSPFPIEYKYGIYDVVGKRFIAYETGPNRVLTESPGAGVKTFVSDGFANVQAALWRGAGVAIPVFSLRSEASFGVGEFTDLKLLTDWCRRVGLKMIQLLPVNDTTATHTCADSYPYAAISAFALHPLYLNLSRLATAGNQFLVREHEQERKSLNCQKDLQYERVMQLKLSVAEKLYWLQKQATFASKEYLAFFAANEHWLIPYALFCYFRDLNGTPDFTRWPRHRAWDAQELRKLATQKSETWDKIALHYFLQFHLDKQLREAKEYAHSQGVILKGDIAIGVARHGADTWQEPELFRMDMQAGAPPDAFGIKGQNWSFPTYDWPRMQQTGFAWWKQRFAQMANYFDAFRIDHMLGFFRIWSVPLHAVEGILGHFVPAIPVQPNEFTLRQIDFNPHRYLRPFIKEAVLTQTFGEHAQEVKERFLDPAESGTYELRPEFATQRQVEKFFATLPTSEKNTKLQTGLYDLISNVVLLPDENDGGRYHFRFSAETTSAFHQLDAHAQHELRQLYVDYFFRRQDDLWMREAMQKLPSLKRVTNMLICGEDLGMVPACVPEVMRQLGLLSLEVQRMPKRSRRIFSSPKDAPYLSVVTPGTHDMSTLRGWWLEDRHVTQTFYHQELDLQGSPPEECEPWISQAIVRQHLDSPAMWSVFMLQDLLGMDPRLRRPEVAEERINVPADAKNYWRYRMHLTLEDLLAAKDFNQALSEDIAKSGRA